jgi:SHS2 domain-containing protein
MDREKTEKTRHPPEGPDWLEALDHTADAGIVVYAADLKELFARAAWGMFSVITDVNEVKPAEKVRIAVEANDRHALMVSWLSELNYRHVTEHRLFCRFDISTLTDQRLEAEVHGEKTDHERHTIYTEIKAITFHALQIEKADGRWKATIIFDL